MKVVINNKYGGFGLSYEGVMRYAELKGIKLYAYVAKKREDGLRIGDEYEPYDGKEEVFIIHYSTVPLEADKVVDSRYFSYRDIPRNDTALIKVVEELGKKANGQCAELKIVEIPDDVEYIIEEYDGNEWVSEKHRTWS